MANKKEQIASKKSPFWIRVNELLNRSVRKRRGVNLSRLSTLVGAKATVVVCDKVLATGKLMHPMTIAAPAFSASAKVAIAAAGGKAMGIEEMQKTHPTGKDVSIII
ncbi:50S ribosomal protein L18e [uncultured archaeon]|nr:50S ribosomal protein L18e [uncultured archaeon]